MGEAAPGFRWRFERCGAATESIAAEAGVVLSVFILGHRTASGEEFRTRRRGAYKRYPFGSTLRVTMDGKSATCPRDRPRSVRTRANYRSYARGCACIGVLGA